MLSFPLSRDRISTIASGAEITDVPFPVTRERLEGYRQAAESAGIAWRDVVVAVCGHIYEIGPTRWCSMDMGIKWVSPR